MIPHAIAMSLILASAPGGEPGPIAWSPLPAIPDKEGFAGSFAGASGGALMVAGGANFPDARPWEGGTKTWYDRVFVLESRGGTWREAGRLPRPSGYGASITHDDAIICAGGGDAARQHDAVFRMRWRDGALQIEPMRPLPRPCANLCGAVLADTLYVAGGIGSPDATSALRTFWALDLSDSGAAWRELEPWPGPARMLAVAGAQDGAFFLFGGTDLRAGNDGRPERIWLRDAYRYRPGAGWSRIADLPRPSVAAPSPAPAVGQSHLLILGGDDGAQLATPPAQHRGFPRDVLAYHTITDTWTKMGDVPFSLVTTPAVPWGPSIVVPGGEARPGVRSPEAWSAEVVGRKPSFGWLNYAALFAYLGGMVLIGWACTRRNRDTTDYFKAGGRIPWWAAGISIYATMLSSLTFMAIPAKAYATDWTFFWANVPILILAPVVIRLYLPFFRRLDVTSAYEYLERRFGLGARLYGSAAFILFQIGRQAIVLLLPSLALATVSDLDVRLCIILMGVLCVAYTVMGGMEAVVWTDVAQTFVLLGAAAISLVIIVAGAGGPVAAWEAASAAGKFHQFNWTLDPSTGAHAFWAILIGNIFINLVPYTSDQAVVQRYLTTRDEARSAQAIWANALLCVPSTALFFAIGTALYVFYRAHPAELDPSQATDTIFPAFIVANLPAGIAGFAIAGIFAAAQSTVSGSLNSVVTAMMTDFYRRFRSGISEPSALRTARWLTAGVGAFATVAALALAEWNLRSLWDTYNSLVGLAGSGLAALFALGIFTRRASGPGAIAGIIASAAALYWVQRHSDIHFFLYASIGFLTCFGVGWLTSLALPGRSRPLSGLVLSEMAMK